MSPEPSAHPVSRRGLRIAAISAAVIAVLIVGGGIASRASNSARLSQLTAAQALPVVAVSLPKVGAGSHTLDLPGRLEAYNRAPIYARISGYLKDWKVDIGARVHAGELLAEIDAPDVDQQLSQTRADLLTAQANAALARTTAVRWNSLLKTDAVSKQAVDEKNSDFAAKEAIVKATEANVHRLEVTEGFKRIVAPFDGVVTTRNTDIGDLINAGAANGVELFVVSDTRKMRLYVNVPQNYAAEVVPGTKATLTVPQRPGETFTGVVEASAQSVDPNSGATLVQLGVHNEAGELFPGAFANVHFDLPLSAGNLSVPASSLIFDSSGLRVATLDANNRVSLKPVVVARDLGDMVEISSGLARNDRIIDSPPDGIGKGDRVRLAPGSASNAMLADTKAVSPREPGRK